MRNDIKVDIRVGTLLHMTPEQLASLQKNILAEGLWETADGLRISGMGDYIGVQPMRFRGARGDETFSGTQAMPEMFIGIERDGYAHS